MYNTNRNNINRNNNMCNDKRYNNNRKKIIGRRKRCEIRMWIILIICRLKQCTILKGKILIGITICGMIKGRIIIGKKIIGTKKDVK